jgi:prefoldin subunit 5
MTSEEMERAIEILLNNQARYELQLEQTNQQLQQTNEQLQQTNEQVRQTNGHIQQINLHISALTESVGMVAQSQREFMQVMLKYMQSQDETNNTFRDAIRELSSTLKRHITEDHGGKS